MKKFVFFALSFVLAGCGSDSNHSTSPEPSPENKPPIAKITASGAWLGGKSALLSAEQSSDPEGSSISFLWQQTGGPDIQFEGSDEIVATIQLPTKDVSYQVSFKLIVTDDQQQSSEETIVLDVHQANMQVFAAQYPLPDLHNLRHAAVEDMNADGLDDLIVATGRSNANAGASGPGDYASIDILLNQANGEFTVSNVLNNLSAVYLFEFVDLTKDGYKDVLFTTAEGFTLLERQDATSFHSPRNISAKWVPNRMQAPFPYSVERWTIDDVNGDGLKDVVWFSKLAYNDSSLRPAQPFGDCEQPQKSRMVCNSALLVSYQEPDGEFSSPVVLETGFKNYHDYDNAETTLTFLDTLDVDNDGVKEVVATFAGVGVYSLKAYDRTGAVSTLLEVQYDLMTPDFIRDEMIADLDGDGDLDVYLNNSHQPNWLEMTESGLLPAAEYAGAVLSLTNTTHFDVNQDGVVDEIMVNQQGYWLRKGTESGFGDWFQISQDACCELFGAFQRNEQLSAIGWRLADGELVQDLVNITENATTTVSTSNPISKPFSRLALVSSESSNNLGILGHVIGENNAIYFRQDNLNEFSESSFVKTPDLDMVFLLGGFDLNGNGDMSAVWIGQSGNKFHLVSGTSMVLIEDLEVNGGYTFLDDFDNDGYLDLVEPNLFRFSDIDSDGDLDIFVRRTSTVYFNHDGTFNALEVGPLYPGEEYHLIDVNNDGKQDILGSGYVFLQTQEKTFAPLISFSGAFWTMREPVLFELDGEAGKEVLHGFSLLKAHDNGIAVMSVISRSEIQAVEDIDQDGLDDLYLSELCSLDEQHFIPWLKNNGNMDFSQQRERSERCIKIHASQFRDIDNDGRLDVSLNEYCEESGLTWYRQVGESEFELSSQRGGKCMAVDNIQFADIDGNQRLDAVATSADGKQIFQSLH